MQVLGLTDKLFETCSPRIGALVALALFSCAALSAEEPLPPGSYQVMDYGPVIAETIRADWPAGNVSAKGLAVRLDHEAAMVFDTDLMRWAVGTVGGWIDLSQTSHTSYKGSRPASTEGRKVFATAPIPGWSHRGSFADPREGKRGNLPAEQARWGGFFRHGDRVLLSYRASDIEVLESPFAFEAGGALVFGRDIRLSRSADPVVINVAQIPDGASHVAYRQGSLAVYLEDRTLVFRAASDDVDTTMRFGEGNRIELQIAPHAGPSELRFLVWEENADTDLDSAVAEAAAARPVVDFGTMMRGGPARWEEKVETFVKLGEDDAAYVTDRLELPFDNPWNSWIRPSGFDFFADGTRAAVSTWNGDVWIVSGFADMEKLSWRRFASGLFYPMGLVVRDETIHVIERGQLTRLHDLNGNGEADFYENINNEGILHPMGHSLCLETDSEGNFYFYKNGNRVRGTVPGHGALIRVSSDGSKREVFATGIRGSNTLAIGPDDVIMGADQQGNWVPTARVDWLQEGGFYGFVPHNPTGRAEGDFDPPVCWIPHQVDNSSGAMIHASDERWGPMHGNWLIGSYGQATLLALLVETKGDLKQGGVVQFPLKFESGLVRARINLRDGQLYLLGLKGWQTLGPADGSFDRVRYTGLPNRLPIALNVEEEGVRIRFSELLDPASVVAENFTVKRWQYDYSQAYGSPEMSVANPGQRGRDPLAVADAILLEDGRSVLVKIPEMEPVMQQAVSYKLRFADGVTEENTLYHTIHRIGDDDPRGQVVARSAASPGGGGDDDAVEEDLGDWSAFSAGKETFETTCMACHQPAGQQSVAPALSKSDWAAGTPEPLIRIVLQGKIGEQGMMMPFAWLSDEDLAQLLSYIRVRWHGTDPVSTEEVRTVRTATSGRTAPWSVEELRALEE